MKFETLYDKHGTMAVGHNERSGRFEMADEPSFSDVRSDVVLARVRERYPEMELMNAGELAKFKAEQDKLAREEQERLDAEEAERACAERIKQEEEAKREEERAMEYAGGVVAAPVSEVAV